MANLIRDDRPTEFDGEEEIDYRKDHMKLRKLLWLHHGHVEFLYGDDGEMQCSHNDCRLDFKRDSVDTIVKRFDDAMVRRMVEYMAEHGKVVDEVVEKTLDE